MICHIIDNESGIIPARLQGEENSDSAAAQLYPEATSNHQHPQSYLAAISQQDCA